MADEPAPLATTVNLQGRISAASRAALLATNVPLRGSIRASGRIATSILLSGPANLQGTIRSAAHISHSDFTISLIPPTAVSLQGIIGGRSRARVAPLQVTQLPTYLYGNIFASGVTQLSDSPSLVSALAGRTISITTLGAQSPLALQPLLAGSIFVAARARSDILEIQEPLDPYPPPFLTFTTVDYLNRITSEHNQRPKYMATVEITADPIVQQQQLVAGVAGLFDLDYCVGEQEDFTGQWIGKSRWIELPIPFFSWDTQSQGWNQANWKGPADATNSLQRLDDYHYRLLLYANIIANQWNGSIPTAYAAWDTLFRYTGIKVLIQDYGNMTMLYGLVSTSAPDNVLLALFTTGQMDLRPEGVQLRAYALQAQPSVPFFSWDSASDSVHGWDTGQWGIFVPPGQVIFHEGET